MGDTWFESWENILRIICITPLAFGALVLILRVSGKRTLSKMNAFDFVITIALGSVLAGVILNQNIPLADGIIACLSLIGLQFLFTWLSVRFKIFRLLITSRPSLIFYKGAFLHKAMKKERISVMEIYSIARQKGISSLDGIDLIILEAAGDIAIIEKVSDSNETTLEDVEIESDA